MKGADSAAASSPPTAAANAPRAGATGLVIPMMLDAAGAAEAQQVLSNVNRNIALFVRDLCHVMDRGHMADVIGSVVAELSDAPIKVIFEIWFFFFKIYPKSSKSFLHI